MDENKQVGNPQGRSVFDSLMFGPPRRPEISQQEKPMEPSAENEIETEVSRENADLNVSATKVQDQTGDLNTQNPSEVDNQPPQLDFVQMMQQFDILMDYASKLGPSLKKLGPLFDLLKGKK